MSAAMASATSSHPMGSSPPPSGLKAVLNTAERKRGVPSDPFLADKSTPDGRARVRGGDDSSAGSTEIVPAKESFFKKNEAVRTLHLGDEIGQGKRRQSLGEGVGAKDPTALKILEQMRGWGDGGGGVDKRVGRLRWVGGIPQGRPLRPSTLRERGGGVNICPQFFNN
jgi:hypothetical protein